MQSTLVKLIAAAIVTVGGPASVGQADTAEGERLEPMVGAIIGPLMTEHGIPGMAAGLVTPEGHHVFPYGVASQATGAPVTPETLFEIGSISKTFTAVLASYAQVTGHLSLSDTVGQHVPALAGSAFAEVSVLALATHTPGGMPLQFPATATDDRTTLEFFRQWQPAYPQGTYRTYANPGIGMLGMVAANSLDGEFTALMEGMLYPALALASTYLEVPDSEWQDYAQGYSREGEPARMSPGVMAAEAYGVRMTAGDLVRFVEANIGGLDLDADLARAIVETHTGYYRLGAMTQDLVWEQYAWPADVADVIAGTSPTVSLEPNAVTAIIPPMAPRGDVLINKTGSTRGFGAYVAFVPGRHIGVVLLANRNYPTEARVAAAFALLDGLGGDAR